MFLSIRKVKQWWVKKRLRSMNVQPILQVWWHDRLWSRLVLLVKDKAQHFTKHNKTCQWICEILINTVSCCPKTDRKVAKNFKRKSSIRIQIWLSKNDNIQVHQYIGMSQDLNPNPSTYSSLTISMFWACERQRSIFLVLQWESSNGKSTKLHIVAASDSRNDQTRSLYYCLFAPHIYGCCS